MMRNSPTETAFLPDVATRANTGSIRHEIRACSTHADFLKLRPSWEAVCTACPATLEFAYCELAAAKAFARGAAVSVALVYDGAALVALWPLCIAREGACRVARALGCGSNEEYGGPLVSDRGDRRFYDAAVDALRSVDADVLEIRFVESGGPLHEALSRAPLSWVLRALPERWRLLSGYAMELSRFPTFDAFIATRPDSLRRPLRRLARRLSEDGAVEYGWCKGVDDARAVLTWLFATKRHWVLSRGLDAPYLMNDDVRDFFIELAGRTDLVATPLVSFVKLDGVPIAASVNLTGPRRLEYFITTYDEAYAARSVGNLLVDSMARWALANGRDFDFRPYFSSYKERWSNHKSWYESHFVILTWRGRLVEFPLAAEQLRRVLRRAREFAIDPLRAKLRALTSAR
ncbi:GNAT family N-acetyltransferase [Paraburkholderia sp. CNPSo 3281]|uniref:GNAT family N-acetyltransferase n=1 Tax=Paraburkholderia sp. CNPSo 3281 TaxID=2940933 RepID=UPI0020B77501|nr:GNAT family N-acetyltransferase [Paraburkholderia sp. CNPSo 3281]MCP3718323.1 GNAT family N-acetyltransferase [Paraburkholderia sp. CNPSo 3281]